jgi:hypothetical protein
MVTKNSCATIVYKILEKRECLDKHLEKKDYILTITRILEIRENILEFDEYHKTIKHHIFTDNTHKHETIVIGYYVHLNNDLMDFKKIKKSRHKNFDLLKTMK